MRKLKSVKMTLMFVMIALLGAGMVSCDKTNRKKFGVFKVQNETTAEMNGTINSGTLKDFNKMMERHPKIKQINIKNVPGSKDDDTNLKVSKRVHDLGIATHLNDNGEIASGGVDFFLAGTTRTMGSNAKIGVHSWSDGSNQATDYAVGHANHLPYIQFYTSVGFTQQQAEDFYYFTINAAPASGIHWMTPTEIEQYNILTQ